MPKAESLSLAVRALATLASHPDGVVSSPELGRLLGAHPVVLRRVLGRLRWDGLVETGRGPGGGYALRLEPARIGLGRVFAALRETPAEAGNSKLDTVLASAEEAYERALGQWTLAELQASEWCPL